MSNNNLERAALWYADKGWPVLPLHSPIDGKCSCGDKKCRSPAKHPRIKNGVYGATKDSQQIKKWWRAWPSANIGIAMGEGSGLIAFDVDIKEDGPDELAKLEEIYETLPDTLQQITSTGGMHYIFEYPGSAIGNKTRFAPGLDIKTEGGYIIVAPSVGINGRQYVWELLHRPEETRPAAMPEWLKQVIKNVNKAKQNKHVNDVAPIPEGQRNSTLASIAGIMRRQGLSGKAMLAALLVINSERCNPPLDKAEVESIALSIEKYAPTYELVSTEGTKNKELKPQPKLICVADVEREEVGWLCKPYLPRGKLTILQGDPGIGKTFVAMEIASAVSNGFTVMHDPTLREPTNVLIFTAEDGLADTIRPRLEKAKADMNRIYTLAEDEALIGFRDTEVLRTFLEEIKPALVIFDPIQAFLTGCDFHKANEVRPLLSGIARLMQEYKCACLLIGHMNKGGNSKALYRSLGSIDLPAAARSVLLVGEEPNTGRKGIAHIKSSLAEKGKTIGFKIDPTLGFLWDAEECDLSAEDLLAAPEGNTEKISEAKKFLLEQLSDGPKTTRELQKTAENQDIKWRTIQRAKHELGVTSTQKEGFGGRVRWYLPLSKRPE